MKRRKKSSQRKRVGHVSYYLHHGAWFLYYLEYQDGVKVQRRHKVADTEEEAAQIAAQVNAQLASSSPTPFSFTPRFSSRTQRWKVPGVTIVISSLIAFLSGLPYFRSCARS